MQKRTHFAVRSLMFTMQKLYSIYISSQLTKPGLKYNVVAFKTANYFKYNGKSMKREFQLKRSRKYLKGREARHHIDVLSVVHR